MQVCLLLFVKSAATKWVMKKWLGTMMNLGMMSYRE